MLKLTPCNYEHEVSLWYVADDTNIHESVVLQINCQHFILLTGLKQSVSDKHKLRSKMKCHKKCYKSNESLDKYEHV